MENVYYIHAGIGANKQGGIIMFECNGFESCSRCPFEDCRRPDRCVENYVIPIENKPPRLGRKFYQVYPDGRRVMFASVTEASRVTGADSAGISRCLNGKLKTTKGCTWVYA